MNHYGPEFADDPRLGALKKAYVKVFGIPISGMRIRLRRILPEIQGDFTSIADLGCGKGIFSFELARRFPRAQVVGIDIDEKQVAINREIGRKHGHENVTFEVGDILKLHAREKFDLVLSVDNLEHIADDGRALGTIHESLKPGGTLFCHVPALDRIWLFAGMRTNFDVEGHVRPGYRQEEITERIEQAGFEIEWIKPTYGYLETVTNNLSYLITGARQKNAMAYALAFPLLNAVAWLGRNQDPGTRGAGFLVRASKSGSRNG